MENEDYNEKILKQFMKNNEQGPLDMYESPFKCCKNCPNNIKNNPASGGICCCSLPDQEMLRW